MDTVEQFNLHYNGIVCITNYRRLSVNGKSVEWNCCLLNETASGIFGLVLEFYTLVCRLVNGTLVKRNILVSLGLFDKLPVTCCRYERLCFRVVEFAGLAARGIHRTVFFFSCTIASIRTTEKESNCAFCNRSLTL